MSSMNRLDDGARLMIKLRGARPAGANLRQKGVEPGGFVHGIRHPSVRPHVFVAVDTGFDSLAIG